MRYGSEGSLLRRIGWIAAGIIIVLWVIRNPAGAAAAAKGIGHFANQAADAFGKLASNL